MVDAKFVERFIKTLKFECPHCGSTNIDIDWKEGEGNELIIENICDDCNGEWSKHYKLIEEYIRNEEEKK
ncbi:MAG: hypothetical protein JRG97_04485 [Deltaproteobacteria bacterium]|nr:hypothetical protein [Deltaproteobacteria bacterium]MBW2051248.1 hypothetical protein [Deltaproteobacteria bacterium]MBW2140316.1 hypothetical protein [Deltaproteobacteria bacterium]MBW2323548.1 hypothetical protein [Deltaproteobacteria bacterium]